MRKKPITILALALALMLVLTGCIRTDVVVDIDENGAAAVSGTVGISEAMVTAFGQSPEEILDTSDYTVQYIDGVKFYVAEANQSYDDIDELDMEYFDDSDLPDSDSYAVYRVEGGYGLNIYIAPKDPDGPGDFGIPGFDGSVAELTAGLNTVFEIRTPYPARQVKGAAVSGIIVEGNSVKVDLEKLAEHGEAYYSFLFTGDGAENPAASVFTDVTPGSWYEEAVLWAADNGYIKGAGGKFLPDNALTRGAVFTILARVDGVDTEGGSTWYQKGLDWAVENGISDGKNVEDSITLEQLVTMLYRYEDSPEVDASVLDRFSDRSDVSGWAADGMAWAVEIGLVKGNADGTLAPGEGLARSRGALVLQRYILGEE